MYMTPVIMDKVTMLPRKETFDNWGFGLGRTLVETWNNL